MPRACTNPSHFLRWTTLAAIITGTWLLTRACYSLLVPVGYRTPASMHLWRAWLDRIQPPAPHAWVLLLLAVAWITGANLELFLEKPVARPFWLVAGLASLGWTGLATSLAALSWTLPLAAVMAYSHQRRQPRSAALQ